MDKSNQPTLKKLCPQCGKPLPTGRRLGSLTGFLFGAADCQCGIRGGDATGAVEHHADDNIVFCQKCGLQKVAEARDGSLTGFLFQSTRCKCAPDAAFAEGSMSSKFYKLKEENTGNTFDSVTGYEDERTGESTTRKSKFARVGLAQGAIIGGAYEILELIGRGGMGEVYLARHKTLGKKCALKVIPPEQVTEEGWLRFQLEAKAVAKVDHVNLVRVTDLGIHEGCLPYYAMDYVAGRNLAEMLAAGGTIPSSVVVDVFMQVCDGVDYAHRSGILHRDLKPANIMVTEPRAGQRQAKVLDFGLAKLTAQDRDKQSLTVAGDIFGSPQYMSPEQCKGAKIDRRSDIYSLGCTMFECLTGRAPFTGNNVQAVMFSQVEAEPPTLADVDGPGKFSDDLEIVLAKLLRKNPVERYQTLHELHGDLEKIQHGEHVDPIYVSRTREVLAEDSAAAAGKESEEASGTIPNFLMPALIGLTVLLIAAGTTLYFVRKPKPIIPKPVTATDVDETRTKPPPASYKDKEPYSRIANVNGVRTRIFEFPQDIALGTLFYGVGHTPIRAKGRAMIPDGESVYFEPDYCIQLWPDYAKRFQPGDIYGVRVSERPDLFGKKDALEYRRLFLEALWPVPGVQSLEVCCDNQLLEDADVALIEKFPDLQEILIRGTSQDPKVLAKYSKLDKMKEVRLLSDRDVTPIIDRINGSSALGRVNFEESNLTLDQIREIARCHNLYTVIFRGVSPRTPQTTTRALEVLSTLPNLQTLSIVGTGLSMNEDVVPVLKRFKKLGMFEYPVAPNTRAQAVSKKIHEALPHLFQQDLRQKAIRDRVIQEKNFDVGGMFR